jgi:magnesium transporter
MEAPSAEEIATVAQMTGIDEEYMVAALDEDEVAHIDNDEGIRVIVVDIPKSTEDGTMLTRPLAILRNGDFFVTVCSLSTSVVGDFFENKIKNVNTAAATRLGYQILMNNAKRFLYYLRKIDKLSASTEQRIKNSMSNAEITELLALQKSLVYFSASLSGNYATIQKIMNTAVRTSEEERDLIEDVILETKQAIEMCSVYREVIKSTMDAYAAIVNNNQNVIIKFLAAITIILSIPMVFGTMWGMNTGVPWEGKMLGFWIVSGIAVFTTLLATIFMMRKKML